MADLERFKGLKEKETNKADVVSLLEKILAVTEKKQNA